ncbi:nuclease-related domain-containing protein [Pseudomonas sp. Marseille-Q5115]|uniref:nuclease-related domain-containing protein n=1 Tax=Pseudomonas sp. Marseille-Q5115 TaxID=2866593 RepID=UPI0039A69752
MVLITPALLLMLKPAAWGVAALVAINLLKTPWARGYVGELLVRSQARRGLPDTLYHPLHNVTLRTPDGTTQIDHVFVSPYGVFVLETKHMRGWIFGGERQAQ